ncbi:MAG TPA: ankyrin repeat domain-containing protein [Thermoanaerobaculia bacterium]|nr:ankyrin repeat domain-containing protein [Thermoanaerobaculia bacterium]
MLMISLLLATSEEFVKAVSASDLTTVNAMLQSDPTLASATNSRGISVTMVAMFAIPKGAEVFRDPKSNDVLQAVLARKPKFGLYETAAFGTAEQLDALLKEDPKRVAERTPFGWTPLHIAAFAGNVATTELLISRGADVNSRAKSKFRNTPLQTALLSGQYATAKLLLDHGADPLVRQAEGITPMHEAAQNGREDLVKLLLSYGAEVTSRADDGSTPMDLAKKAKHENVVALLTKAP